MNTVLYDGTFNGLLSAFFEVYEYKIADANICSNEIPNTSLFGSIHDVKTDESKSARVYQKLKEKIAKNSLHQIYTTFLSGENNIENVLLRYVQYVLRSTTAVDNDYSNADVLMVQQMSRKVHREKHRMEAFVRFQLTKDQLYYAIIQPDYNVLPLISTHFEKRYADQRWLIYDISRKYGIYYDLNKVEEIQMSFTTDLNNSSELKIVCDEKEELYQQLWQQYFKSVNIAARKNTRLHIQHMPKRYWKHLIEKQNVRL